MKYSTVVCAVIVVLVLATSFSAQRMLLDQRYLNEFPTVDRIKEVMLGTDDVDTFARFLSAVSVIDDFILIDLVTAPNGGAYTIPPPAWRIHDKYLNTLAYYAIDHIPPQAGDPRYRSLRNKYKKDPAFAAWLLQRLFSQQFTREYYAWTRKPIPPQESVNAITVIRNSRNGELAPPMTSPQKPTACPKISIKSPSEIDEGQSITFTASVTGGDPVLTVTYNWVLTAGTISSGQGTSVITVDTTRADAESITATVQVGGLDRICKNGATFTTELIPKPSPARMFDQFGSLKPLDRNARLDDLAIQLQNDPTTKVYIIAYAGRKEVKNAAAATLKKMKDYLGWTRAIELTRIVTVDGGTREVRTTELWIVPRGSTPPSPSPTVKKPVKRPAKPVPRFLTL